MIEAKFSLEESQLEFLNHYQEYGFQDKSEVVRIALARFQADLEQESLEESAKLYAELYTEDDDLKQLTESALLEEVE